MTHSNTPRPDEGRRPAQPDEPGEEDGRGFVNIVALAFVVALTLGGVWLFTKLNEHNQIQNCIASGRRACIDLVHPDAPPP